MVLTSDLLKEILHYDSETGVFTWLKSSRPGWSGKPAGTPHTQGYTIIKIGGKQYKAHRLAWLYMNGEWPLLDIDHENGAKSDNRIANLRQATMPQNQANRGPQKNNKIGLKGVYWHRRSKRWAAQICGGRNGGWIGAFDCPAAAHLAYLIEAEKRYGEFAKAS